MIEKVGERINQFVSLGTDPKKGLNYNKRIILLNYFVLVGTFNLTFYTIILSYFRFWEAVYGITFFNLYFISIRPLIRKEYINVPKLLMPVVFVLVCNYMDYFLGGMSNIYHFYYPLMLMPLLMFSLKEWHFIGFSIAAYLVGFTVVNYIHFQGYYYGNFPENISKILAFASPISSGVTLCIFGWVLFYNNEKAEETLNIKNEEVTNLLNNLRQGIIVIDRNMKIMPGYSSHTEVIIGRGNLEKLGLKDLLEMTKIAPDLRSQIYATLFAAIDDDLMTFEVNQHILPEKIFFENGSVVHAFWEPIHKSDTVYQIMIVMKDITESERISAEAQAKDYKLQIISQILECGPDIFLLNISNSLNYIETTKKSLTKMTRDGNVEPDNLELKTVFRNIHTIKGNARVFKLSRIVELCHKFETDLESMVANTDISLIFEKLNPGSKEIQDRLMETKVIYQDAFEKSIDQSERTINQLVKEFLSISEDMIDNDLLLKSKAKKLVTDYIQYSSRGIGAIIAMQIEAAKKIAGEIGIAIPDFIIEEGGVLFKKKYHQILQDILNHLIRNCIDHGVANMLNAKNVKGQVRIKTSKNNDYISLVISDSGPGLNIDKISSKLLTKSLPDYKNPKGSDEEIANAIFLANFSTKDEVSEISGRGVGMDFVYSQLQSIGATIKIVFDGEKDAKGYRKFHFDIRFRPDIDIG